MSVISVAREDIHAIEEAFIAMWAHFGQGPGGAFHNDDQLVWTEAPVAQLPYNAILRTRLGANADDRIRELIARFRERGVQFLWLVHPTAQPGDLAERLIANGLPLVERATGMSLDLGTWKGAVAPKPGPIAYREVTDDAGMSAYEALIADYWELPAESRPYVFGINRWARELGERGTRLVAYRDGRPAGKAYLSYLGVKDTAAIFGVYVRPEARGHGVATVLTELLIQRAIDLGRKRVVLHSSEMAVKLYRRMGFTERCTLPVYATTALHGLQPS
jgi:GNAT superfamily N-acetyltransferase